MSKTIYYYQTFIGLEKLIQKIDSIDVIIVSAIHFGFDNNGPYIHLNDNDPNSNIFCNMWNDLQILHNNNVKIMFMLGGGGGAYTELFNNYDIFYPKLIYLLKTHLNVITGIDIDIEETVEIKNAVLLIKNLKKDMGDTYDITMAPMSSELLYDEPGMAGFIYKDLYNIIGNDISFFHVQAYSDFNVSTVDNIIKNGYPPVKLIIGMVSEQFRDNFDKALTEIKNIKHKYTDIAGIFNWEYFDSPPDPKDPSKWVVLVKKALS